MTPRPRLVPILGLLALLLALLGGLAAAPGCRSSAPIVVAPVPAEATASLTAAQAGLRAGDAAGRTRARAAARDAVAAAPDWVAPRRLLDDLDREDLLGIEALARRREELRECPDDATLWYLTGRLEGDAGAWRFERAVELDPSLAWGHHGRAWSAARDGDWREALQHEERALERARNGWERAFFAQSAVRFLVASDDAQEALTHIEERLADPELGALDRLPLELQAVQIELGLSLGREGRRGYERGLALLRERDLVGPEVDQLAADLRPYTPFHDPGGLELQLALAARAGPVRDRLRAELLLDDRPTPLALGLLRRALEDEGRPPPAGPLARAARFAGGQFRAGVEVWLAGLPRTALAIDGLPRDPVLREVVRRARALGPRGGWEADAEPLAGLGDALVDAGWFVEARSVAAALAANDLEGALALEDRAAAGQHLLRGVRRLMESLDGDERERTDLLAARAGPDGAGLPQGVDDLDDLGDLLAAMGGLTIGGSEPLLGEPASTSALVDELRASPLLEYGFVGSLVHPGPRFSEADEAAGRGRRGEPVPGLARLFARLGRFALIGTLAGSPDGTVLRRVLAEEREGQHLGTPWSGIVVLCEGVDLRSRMMRRGAEISGAALHEGYWIDLEAIRRHSHEWAEFERRFAGEDNAERVERALAARGLALSTPARDRAARRAEHRRVDPLLNEADRVRLAILRDRRAQAEGGEGAARGPLVGLDELLEVTSIHEEGHLCDRTRFLPISRHLGRALRLLARSGFSFRAVTERLEYRAQLVALCSAPDPRIPLYEILRAADGTVGAPTPHPQAYRALLEDLLEELERQFHEHPHRWPELDGDHLLVHQLHFVAPDKLRQLALRLAGDEGLDDR